MSDLPSDRMQEAPPFTYFAVDYFGPFYIKEKRKEVKQYGSLSTCHASRAVHIEVADSLDTDSFIMALRCCISLRGNIHKLHSDWGTNFVGAERELRDAGKEMNHEKIKDFLQNNGADYMLFKCKRNPPVSSHMGGVWERQTHSVRQILSSLMRTRGLSLSGEAFRSFMVQVAAVLNSRPLTANNLSNPDDPPPLCPSQLITLKSKVILPPPGQLLPEDICLQRQWRRSK